MRGILGALCKIGALRLRSTPFEEHAVLGTLRLRLNNQASRPSGRSTKPEGLLLKAAAARQYHACPFYCAPALLLRN